MCIAGAKVAKHDKVKLLFSLPSPRPLNLVLGNSAMRIVFKMTNSASKSSATAVWIKKLINFCTAFELMQTAVTAG